MINPYKILNVPQDASKKDIMRAQIQAMKEKKYPLSDIATASRQLLNPSKRLAADFLHPSKIRAKRPHKITIDIDLPDNDLEEIDENAFDSLKLDKTFQVVPLISE
jgi:hypothetical protein